MCIYQRAGNEPAFDLKAELFRIAGVDLTDVPGISTITAHTILMEVGPDISRFRNASAFASWLGLCPEKQSQRRKSPLHAVSKGEKQGGNCTASWGALPLPCQELPWRFHRKMKWRLGAPEAVTATAHKLARIVYHLLSTKEPYSESVLVNVPVRQHNELNCACAGRQLTLASS